VLNQRAPSIANNLADSRRFLVPQART